MKKKLLNFILIFISLTLPLIVEKYGYPNVGFSIDRYIILTFILLFVSSHFIFDRKKMWDFVYRKRYIIGLVIFAFCVINGYHGSSVSKYNEVIQPSEYVKDSNPIFFEARVIRGDEWAVSTPMILSQYSIVNNHKSINKTMMASENSVTLYPRLPVKDISILTYPQLIPFLFFNHKIGFSMYWNLCYFTMFFAVFEFLMLITKKNRKYSLLGAIMITFAPATQWWEAYNIITFGALAMLFLNGFFKSETWKNKIKFSALLGWSGSCYIMCMYPAWQITYGYFFLMIVIWLFYVNRKKINLKNMLLLFGIVVSVCIVILLPSFISSKEVLYLMTHTVYPGARFSTGGDNWQWLFNYVTSLFTPFIDHQNASEASQFISLYPIPLIISIIALIKYRKKKDLLLMLITGVTIFLNIWNFVQLPRFLAKISLLYMSTPIRSQITVGFLNVVLLIYCLAHYEKEKNNYKMLIYIILICIGLSVFGILTSDQLYPNFFGKWRILTAFIVITPTMILLCINSKKTNNYLVALLVAISLVCGATVHPITKSLNIIYEKPFAKKIEKIVKKDPNAKWATVSTVYYIQNYVLANGARVLNSTNYYPNYDLWKVIDKDKKYENIYNRYAHMNINIVDEETHVDFQYEDAFILNISREDMCKVNIKYLVSQGIDLTEYNTKKFIIKNIYDEDGMKIYKLKCDF